MLHRKFLDGWVAHFPELTADIPDKYLTDRKLDKDGIAQLPIISNEILDWLTENNIKTEFKFMEVKWIKNATPKSQSIVRIPKLSLLPLLFFENENDLVYYKLRWL